jgi:hypothetical protein
MGLVNWIKAHKVALILLVVAFLLYRFVSTLLFGGNAQYVTNPSIGSSGSSFGAISGVGMPSISLDKLVASSPTNSTERVVIQNSSLSLLVKDVRSAGDQVVAYAKQNGGYMVSTSYNRPNESPFATITVRVPTTNFDAALSYYRSLAIKVTSESLVGQDVTDQYVDIDERIKTLERTKLKFETILESAITTQELLNVQRELISVQSQIDSYKGQKQALEQNASLTKITVFLSTDELALPYAPDKTFRPDVVFKLAVRSLLNSLRILGEALIWIVVYAVIWVPALLIYLGVRRWRDRRKAIK